MIGAGVAGLSTAYALARRGHQVDVFEQYEAFHDRGSSHGRSRIIRRAYPDRRFTEIMVDAYPMWAELEAAASRKLVHEVGLLYLGNRSSANLAEVAAGLEACQVPHELADAGRMAQLAPQIRMAVDEIAIWTPEAGWVSADETLSCLLDLGRHHGAQYHFGSSPTVTTLEGEFDGYAVCAGSWITEWLPLDVVVTEQTFAYVEAQILGPVWIDDAPDLPYGLPSDDYGMKLALHSPGKIIAPRDAAEGPDLAAIERLREVASNRFGIQYPKMIHAKTCRYTSTADEGFRFGRVGESGVYCSACSGHAFKFGPWLGERLARELGVA